MAWSDKLNKNDLKEILEDYAFEENNYENQKSMVVDINKLLISTFGTIEGFNIDFNMDENIKWFEIIIEKDGTVMTTRLDSVDYPFELMNI